MKRLPVLATALVSTAVAAMIALGVWQLHRADEKVALLARYASASTLPEMAFPAMPIGDDLLFRRAAGFCLSPISHRVEAGRNVKGEGGWRHLVDCRRGAEGLGMVVDIGWSKGFKDKPDWQGGPVSGVISAEPEQRSLLGKALGRGNLPRLMLIAATPAPGLAASAPPRPESIPNNHLAYAVQWFVFAGIAALIFGIALYRRRQPS